MWLKYLPANLAWVYLFGDDVSTATIVEMDGQRFFPSRSEAVAAGRRAGLTVTDGGAVVA